MERWSHARCPSAERPPLAPSPCVRRGAARSSHHRATPCPFGPEEGAAGETPDPADAALLAQARDRERAERNRSRPPPPPSRNSARVAVNRRRGRAVGALSGSSPAGRRPRCGQRAPVVPAGAVGACRDAPPPPPPRAPPRDRQADGPGLLPACAHPPPNGMILQTRWWWSWVSIRGSHIHVEAGPHTEQVGCSTHPPPTGPPLPPPRRLAGPAGRSVRSRVSACSSHASEGGGGGFAGARQSRNLCGQTAAAAGASLAAACPLDSTRTRRQVAAV